jgi:hypothetical protein
LSSSFSKGYEVIIHTKEKESLRAYLDLLNRDDVKYVRLPLKSMEHPPLDIWFEIPESIDLGLDLLYKWYKSQKVKDLKIVIREPDGRVVEINDARQILDIMQGKRL